jgi:hypothetical protein
MSTQTDQFTRESIPQVQEEANIRVETNEDIFEAEVVEFTNLGDSSCLKLDVTGHDENQMIYADSKYVEFIVDNKSQFVKSIQVLN